MRLYYILIVALISSSFSLFDFNGPKFSGDPELYIKELEAYMHNVSDENEILIETFVKSWVEDSLFSEDEKKDIIDLSIKLDKKNVRPSPHFVVFIKLMLTIKEKEISNEKYANWLKGFEFYLKRKKANTNEILRVLNFSLDLFKESLLYQSRSTKWRAIANDYTISHKKGLLIEYDKLELVCYTRTDSINIFETSGYVDPSENTWHGSGGIVSWERGGFSREQVNAELKDYSILLQKSEYTAENVTFNNKNYFEDPIKGELHDKVQHISTTENATYPRFYSYEKTFEIEDLYHDVNYSGGLSMQGAKMVGQGSRENPAKLSIYRKDTLVLEATSLFFGFKSDRVSSEKTSIVIKLKQDSIYHPDLHFSFRTTNRELTLLKTNSFSSQGPYSNSYHKIDMNFDQLIWRIDDSYMKFTAPRGASIGSAYFESENYFNLNKFIDLQVMDRAHPLISLRSFARKYENTEFPLQAYADYLHQPLTTTKNLIMRMANGGFVFFDKNTDLVKLKPRLDDYVAASVNKIDYDVIAFGSRVDAPLENAVFNLNNYDLVINGIPQIFVSDSQSVGIIPKNAQITLKENRNFQFDGTVTAGLLTFFGKNLFFNYDSFKISLQNVDSVNIDFQTGKFDNYGLPKTASIQNKLEKITGEILIDKPDNKSGRVSHPRYPIFKSLETSFVYYESSGEDGEVYKAEDFYFAIDPFEMDSLDNFNAYSMEFSGSFASAGIFPEFRKELKLQEDNSLGFKHITPPEGMPLYGGKGVFNDDIWLSNNGLRGNGSLNYLTSTTWSDDFHFYPDSMNTLSKNFKVKKQRAKTEYPQTSSVNNQVHWEPYNDVMWAYKTDSDFTMYNDSTTLSGDLQIDTSGLYGWGRMDLKNSDLNSDWFRYKADDIYADTSEFYLKSLKKEGFTVLTENINSHIDFRRKKGVFKSNEDFSLVTFPENKYISYIDYFTWDMNGKKLVIGSQDKPQTPDYTDEDLEPDGPRYISIDPKQDSLNFVSPLAYYDYEKNLINATGVKFVEVADARIYPKDGLLTVQPDYLIKTLENSWVRANKTTKYHTLHTATINIKGRKYYEGMANYDYLDENDDVQLIHFKDVKVDSGEHTVAFGEIYESADFTLSPVFHYQGQVSLFADDSLLTFKGATKIEHNCDKLDNEWITFESRIYPDDIYIPVQSVSKNMNGVDLYAGMFVYYDSVHVYPAFFNPHKNYSDLQMVTPSGFLHFDRASKLYKIGSKAKINDFTLSEDYVSLDRESCKLFSEGNVKLGQNLGQVELINYGSVTHMVTENTTTLDLVMGIDFFLTEDMNGLFGNEIDSFPNLKPVDMQRSLYKKAMNRWVTEPVAKKVQEEIDLFGTVKALPPELKHTILLNKLELVWNDRTNSYQSVGKIGIASINGIQVHKEVDGFFELRIKRSGDIMDLYLQLDRRNYYYFGYTRGIMQVLSSNRQFVETIMNMKNKDKKVKTGRNTTPYKFLISTDRKKDAFYKRWQDMLNNNEAEDEPEEDVL